MNSNVVTASLNRMSKKFHGKEYGGIVGDLLTAIDGNDEKTSEVAEWMCDTYRGVQKMREDRDEPTKNGSYIRASKFQDVIHVDIQPYVIDGVKHYRGRIQGEEDFKFETDKDETLDMFRGRIMNSLNSGIITHFLEEWEPTTKNGSYIRADAINFTDTPTQIDMDGETPRDQDVSPAFPMRKNRIKNTGTPSEKPMAYGVRNRK